MTYGLYRSKFILNLRTYWTMLPSGWWRYKLFHPRLIFFSLPLSWVLLKRVGAESIKRFWFEVKEGQGKGGRKRGVSSNAKSSPSSFLVGWETNQIWRHGKMRRRKRKLSERYSFLSHLSFLCSHVLNRKSLSLLTFFEKINDKSYRILQQ